MLDKRDSLIFKVVVAQDFFEKDTPSITQEITTSFINESRTQINIHPALLGMAIRQSLGNYVLEQDVDRQNLIRTM